MDDRFTPRPVAWWFLPATILSLILMLLGCFGYWLHLSTDPATLPLDQRALAEAAPPWIPGALGIGCVLGAIGAILLILRRRGAEQLMLLALAATIIWFAGLFAVGRLRDLLSTNDIAAAIAVVAIVWTIYWFARHSRQRRWLR